MIKNKNGMIIIFVVVILGLIGILYSSIYILIGVENKIYNSREARIRAYYLAESGAQKGMALINENNILSQFDSYRPLFPEYKGDNWYRVTIDSAAPTYTITSTGYFDKTKRVVEVVVTVDQEGMSIDSWKEIN